MSAVDTTRCAICERDYQGTRSRPRWLFAPDAILIGTAHRSCVRKPLWAESSTATPLDVARFEAWSWLVLPRPVYGTDTFYATLLIGGEPPADDLDDEQRRLLGWWQRGPLGFSAERAARVRERYLALAAEYRDWLAGVRAREGGA